MDSRACMTDWARRDLYHAFLAHPFVIVRQCFRHLYTAGRANVTVHDRKGKTSLYTTGMANVTVHDRKGKRQAGQKDAHVAVRAKEP